LGTYPQRKPSKLTELPPEVARAFVRDMRAFFAEKSSTLVVDKNASFLTYLSDVANDCLKN
jgi:hypothetical protein